MAYCYAKQKSHGLAETMARRAIESGEDTPAVRNIRAYSLFQKANYKDALDELEVLLERSPNFRAARYTRALLYNREGRTSGAVADIEYVLAAEPRSSELCADAARIYAKACVNNKAFRTKALGMMAEAIRLGKDPTSLRRDTVLRRHLETAPEWEGVLSATPGKAVPIDDIRVVEPKS
jgi:tetratricopeptide (TPR) repeat protein